MEEQNFDSREVKRLIETWKELYQGVYVSEVNDIHFVWRGLSRLEYKKAMEHYQDDYDRSEYVCRLCVLDPIDVDYENEIYAGVPEALAAQILYESGFGTDTSKFTMLLNKCESEMHSFDNQISCVIVEAFPRLDIEEVEGWSLEKTLWHYSRAKWILQNFRGLEITQESAQPGIDGMKIQGDISDFPELRKR